MSAIKFLAEIINVLRDALPKEAQDWEFLDEESTDTEGGQYCLFGGAFFLHADAVGNFYLDRGVDGSDPSVGLYGCYEPAFEAKIYSSRRDAVEQIVREWRALEDWRAEEADHEKRREDPEF